MRGLQHCYGNVQRDHLRFRVALRQLARAPARAAARIEYAFRSQLDVIQPLQHARTHFALQHGCGIVVSRSAIEGAAHHPLVDQKLIHVRNPLHDSKIVRGATRTAHVPHR